jgi:hypothetical protein
MAAPASPSADLERIASDLRTQRITALQGAHLLLSIVNDAAAAAAVATKNKKTTAPAGIERIAADLRARRITALEGARLLDDIVDALPKPPAAKKAKTAAAAAGRVWDRDHDLFIGRRRIKKSYKKLCETEDPQTFEQITDKLNEAYPGEQEPYTQAEVMARFKVICAYLGEENIKAFEEEAEEADKEFKWLGLQDDALRRGLNDGKSLEEIADKLGIHEATVRKRAKLWINDLLAMNYNMREDDSTLVGYRALIDASTRKYVEGFKKTFFV